MTDQTFDHDDDLFDDGADRANEFMRICPVCRGYGWTGLEPPNSAGDPQGCTRCGGVGWVERESEVDDAS